MPNQHLVIMVKAPSIGRVKTRLAKDIGAVRATQFYRRTCHTIIRRLSSDPRWQTHLAISPDTAINLPFWQQATAPGLKPKRSKQGNGDLGKRMQHQFKSLSTPLHNNQRNYPASRKKPNRLNGSARIISSLPIIGPVLIIGTDIPAIKPNHIAAAFKQLKQKKAILGPSGDGGYWLVGQKNTPKTYSLFQHVRWSNEHTMNDTLKNLNSTDWATTDCLSDVDDGNDYQSYAHLSATVILSNPPNF